MKTISLLALVLVMAFSLIGCRRKDNTPPTETTFPTIQETTIPTTTPQTEATMETNIPDPTVESNSDMTEDSTDGSSGNLDIENNQTTGEESARIGRKMMR